MNEVTPHVELVAATSMKYAAFEKVLHEIVGVPIGTGEDEFCFDRNKSDGENLTMAAGKYCYKSWVARINPNVSRVRKELAPYLENINKTGHGSVQEHTSVSFILHNVSRVVTHELVRHRAGTAFSQESLRYVRLDELNFWFPPLLIGTPGSEDFDEEAFDKMWEFLEKCEQFQLWLAEHYQIDKKKMHDKKRFTSHFRRFAPIGLATGILFTMNLRAARHIIQMRTSRFAEDEIRLVFNEIAFILMHQYPNIFEDFTYTMQDGQPEWLAENAAMPYDGVKLQELRKENEKLKKEIKKLKQS